MSNPIQTPGQRSILDHTPLFRPSSGLSNASSSSSARRQSLPVRASQAEEGRPSSQGGEPRRKKKKRKTTHGAEPPRGSRLALGDGDWEDEDEPSGSAHEAHHQAEPSRPQSRFGDGSGNAVAGPSRLPARPATRLRTEHRNAEAGPSRPTPSHTGPRLSQQAASSSTTLPQYTTHTSHKRPRAPISPATGPRHHRFVGRTHIPSHVVSPSSRPTKKPRMSAPAALHPRFSLGATQGFTADEPIDLALSEDEAEQGQVGPPIPVPGPPVSVERLVGMLPGTEPRRASPAQVVSSQPPPAATQAAHRPPPAITAPLTQSVPTSISNAQASQTGSSQPITSSTSAALSLSQPAQASASSIHAPRRSRPLQPRTSLPLVSTSPTVLPASAPAATSNAPQPRLDDLLSRWQKDEAARKSKQDADVFSADYQRGASSSSRREGQRAEIARMAEEEEVAEGLFLYEAEESPEPIEQGPVISQALSQAELSQKARQLIDELAAGRAASRPPSGTPSSSTSAPPAPPAPPARPAPPSQSPSQLKAAEEARLAAELAEKERDAEAEAVALREIAEETEEERCISAFLQLSQEEVDFDGEVAREMGRRARRDAIEKECERMREEERDEAAVRDWDIREAKMEAERVEKERLKAATAAKKLKEDMEKAQREQAARKLKEEKERAAKKLKEAKEAEEADARRKAQREAYDRAESKRASKAAADALALEQLAKKAAAAKAEAEAKAAEAKLADDAKARDEKEADAKAERRAAFLKKHQEEQQAESPALRAWREGGRQPVVKEKRKEVGGKTKEQEEKERVEQEDLDLQLAIRLSQEEAAKVAEAGSQAGTEVEVVLPGKGKKRAPDHTEAARLAQLQKEQRDKEKAEKAKADAVANATRETQMTLQQGAEPARLAGETDAAGKQKREAEEAIRALIEDRFWKKFDGGGGPTWDIPTAQREFDAAIRTVDLWLTTKIEQAELVASGLRAIRSLRDARLVAIRAAHLSAADQNAADAESWADAQKIVMAQREAESVEARTLRLTAERQAIGADWRREHEAAAGVQAVELAAKGREALLRRRSAATDAQRKLVASLLANVEVRRAGDRESQRLAREKAAAWAEVTEQRAQETRNAIQLLVEEEYWKLFDAHRGEAWDDATAKNAWFRAGRTIIDWGAAQRVNWEINRSLDQAAMVLSTQREQEITSTTPAGEERNAAIMQVRSEALAIARQQRATETTAARDARIAAERAAQGGAYWSYDVDAAAAKVTIEAAAEKAGSVALRRCRATEAQWAMLMRAAGPAYAASQAAQSRTTQQHLGAANTSASASAAAAAPSNTTTYAGPRTQAARSQPSGLATAAPISGASRPIVALRAVPEHRQQLDATNIPSTSRADPSALAPSQTPTVSTGGSSTRPAVASRAIRQSNEGASRVVSSSSFKSTAAEVQPAPSRPVRPGQAQLEVLIPAKSAPTRATIPSSTQRPPQGLSAPEPPLDQYNPNGGPSQPPAPIPTEEALIQTGSRSSKRSRQRPALSSRSQEDDEPAPIVRQRRSRILFDSDDENASSSSGVRVAALAKRKKMEKVASLVISDDEADADADDDDHTPIRRHNMKKRDDGHSPTMPTHRMRRSVPSTSRKGKEKAVPVIVMDDEDEEEEAVEEVEDGDYVQPLIRSAATREAIVTPPRSQRLTQSTQSTDPRVRPRIAVIPPTQSSLGQSQPKGAEEADHDMADGENAEKEVESERAKGRAASVAAATQSGPGPLFQTPSSRANHKSSSKPPPSPSSAITAVSSPKPTAATSEIQRLLSLRKDDSVDQFVNGIWSKVHRLTGSSAPAPPSPSTTAASRQPPQAVLRVSRDLAPSTSHTTVISTTSTEVDIPRSDSTVPTEVSLQTATSATATDRDPSTSKVEQFLRSQSAASAAGKALQDKFPRVEIRNGASSAAPKPTRASTRNLALPFLEEPGNEHDGDWETETEQDSRPASPAPRRRTRGSRTALSVAGSEVTDSPSARRRSARNSGRTKSYAETSAEEFEAILARRLTLTARPARSHAATEATETSPPPQPRPEPQPRPRQPAYIPTTRPSAIAGPSSRPFLSEEQAAVPASADVDYDVDILRKYGLFCPTMKGRKNNKWTSWSTNVQPGTLMDLMWELDLLYMPGDRERPLMKRMEDEVIWGDMREVSDKRRFLNCCWARWSKERGPLRADLSAEFVHNFIDKYGEILRFAGLDREVTDMIHILNKQGLVGFGTYHSACSYWNRHMRYYRKMKDRPHPLDDDWSDCEENMAQGRIRLKEFEVGGREYKEMVERRRARAEGRAPVLPKEKYVFGMDEEKDVGAML